MEVTFRPVILSRRPVEDATSGLSETKTRLGACETRTDDAFADTTDDASRDENVLHFYDRNTQRSATTRAGATWEGANRKFVSSLNTMLHVQPYHDATTSANCRGRL
jgi:hypothetical protein